ncbi:hypothetical protein FOMG_20007 [Fusarium oxysporum f. sp. melonis 26406]|uniref:Uncharacterized protein n=1 Tax=Fusarium oxysporum f. sp. melonis 26406 TaxID=1089452 RepID=W9Z4M4_FUSOX|nr:hypothetical protein FOMG_20007 [Fusarium oxysporum f. sp. melonis 26406]
MSEQVAHPLQRYPKIDSMLRTFYPWILIRRELRPLGVLTSSRGTLSSLITSSLVLAKTLQQLWILSRNSCSRLSMSVLSQLTSLWKPSQSQRLVAIVPCL